MRIYKTDPATNQLKKCQIGNCTNFRHGRQNLCKTCQKFYNSQTNSHHNPKQTADNTKQQPQVYIMNLHGHYYIGSTDMSILWRAKVHRSNAKRGIHKKSYIHNYIREHLPDIATVQSWMQTIVFFNTIEEAQEFEKVMIAVYYKQYGNRLCNKHNLRR